MPPECRKHRVLQKEAEHGFTIRKIDCSWKSVEAHFVSQNLITALEGVSLDSKSKSEDVAERRGRKAWSEGVAARRGRQTWLEGVQCHKHMRQRIQHS